MHHSENNGKQDTSTHVRALKTVTGGNITCDNHLLDFLSIVFQQMAPPPFQHQSGRRLKVRRPTSEENAFLSCVLSLNTWQMHKFARVLKFKVKPNGWQTGSSWYSCRDCNSNNSNSTSKVNIFAIYGQGFDQACHPFFQCHHDATTNNKGSRVKFSHNQ